MDNLHHPKHLPPKSKAQPLAQFYENLASAMKENNMRFIWSPIKQEKTHISKTIFIPFDSEEQEDKDGYGLYLYLHEIHAPNEVLHCIVASATVLLADASKKNDIALLLHEINFNLPIPGWILDDKENILLFKYLFPVHINENIPKGYLTLILEVFNGITKSFSLLKEVIEGKSFHDIRDEVGSRLAYQEPTST